MIDHFNFIESYVRGNLSGDAKADFERAMREDPDLRDAVENYWRLEPYLDLLIEDDIRAAMSTIRKRKSVVPVRLSRYSRIAAAIALLLALTLTWMWSEGLFNKSPEKLFAEYYRNPPEPITRSGETGTLSQDAKAFFSAHRMIELDSFAEAEDIFADLISSQSLYKSQSEWFLAMIALAKNDKSLAGERLDAILQQEGHEYHGLAMKVKEDL